MSKEWSYLGFGREGKKVTSQWFNRMKLYGMDVLMVGKHLAVMCCYFVMVEVGKVMVVISDE